MLDFFTIFSKGGILLWCFKGAGLLQKEWEALTPAVNTFVKTVLLQEKSGNRTAVFESGSLALKYRLDNEFELVFVAAFQKMLPLLYLDKLLDEIQLRFRDRYATELKDKFFFCSDIYDGFSSEFSRTLEYCESFVKERELKKRSEMRSFDESKKSQKTVASMIENAATAPIVVNNNTKMINGKKGTKTQQVPIASRFEKDCGQEKQVNDDDQLDEDTRVANLNKLASRGKKGTKVKSPKIEKGVKKGKEKTTWDPFMFGGKGATGLEARELERTAPNSPETSAVPTDEKITTDHHLTQFVPDASVVGRSSLLADIDQEDSSDDDNMQPDDVISKKSKAGRNGVWASLFTLVGSKQLSRIDLEPVIDKMREHLISKNVASEVAAQLCESIVNKLQGKVCGTFQTVHRTVKESLTESLMQLLTPKRRVDIIRDVYEAKSHSRPYVMTFCGVNGVGKSTNLAKICFWLVENKFRVLIAACDTFRAGAVEQLRTHVRRLNSLYPDTADRKPLVELYEKGYGKDAAGIALEAINYARQAKIEVVLVDTAGRMQDNEPLMRALAKLITFNDPDLVLFVGEALVGNEAVDQLVKFNAALADHSSSDNPHLIDGIVLTKFDTIDDKVGSAISMTYITGQPILFVGTGQTYADLKTLNAKSIVQSLMK